MDSYEETSKKGLALLDKLYDRALTGVMGSDSVIILANNYLKYADYNKEKAARELINKQIIKCTVSGTISGLGGIMTTFVVLPANIVSVLYVQMRMIMALAHIGGYDIRSDYIKTKVYASLIGCSINSLLKEAGTQIGMKIATDILKTIPSKILGQINKLIGFKLITKFGEKSIAGIGKMIPLLGAVVGGTLDYSQTKAIAEKAYEEFILRDPRYN